MVSLASIKKLASDSLVYGVSGIVSRFIGIFLVPIYTRIFTPADYGVISLVTTLFTLFSILVVLGLDNSLARWFYEDETENGRKLTLNTFLWSCIGVACALGAFGAISGEFMAQKILDEPSAGSAIFIASLNLPLTVFTTFTANVLRIQRRPAAASIFGIASAVLLIGLNVLFVVVLRWGYLGVFYSQLASSAVGAVVTLFLFRGTISLAAFSYRLWKDMFRFSFPLIPGSIAFWVVNMSGVYFIQAFKSVGEVGLFQIGLSIASVMALLTGAFQMAWGPFAFSIHKEPEAKEIYARTFELFSGVTGIAALLITLFSKEVLLVLATPEYAGANWVAGILAYNYILIGFGYIASIGPAIVGNNNTFGVASVISAGLLFLLNLVLVPRMGKEGAAIATLGSQIVVPATVFAHSQLIYFIPYNFSKTFLILAGSAVLGFGVLAGLAVSPQERYIEFTIKAVTAVAYIVFLGLTFDVKQSIARYTAGHNAG